MYCVMKYVTKTPARGLTLHSTRVWDSMSDFEFEISGLSDSIYASEQNNIKSVSGTSVFLQDSPVIIRNGQHSSITLLSVESELVSGVSCAQNKLFCKRVVESIG